MMNRWGIPAWLEEMVRARDKMCVYCGIKMLEEAPMGTSRKLVATWEHIINDASIITPENIARCCTSCNSSKGTKALSDWLPSNYCISRGINEMSVSEVVKQALKNASPDAGFFIQVPFELMSERLIFRYFNTSDFEQVHAYATDKEVVRFMEWGPNSREATRDFIERAQTFANESPPRTFELAVVEASTGKVIGGIGFHTKDLQAMLGYCFSRSAWGKGYATEAARFLISWGFKDLGIHRVWARCDSENIASLKVLEKMGLRREGLTKHDCQIRGEWRNTFLYAVLEHEWEY